MTEQQRTLQQQVIAKAMKDEAFRQQLLNDPMQVLEQKLGITLPQGVTIQVHEDTLSTLHLVLPMAQPPGQLVELSDEELERAAGGSGRNCILSLDAR